MSRIYVIMYHYVRDIANSRYPGIKGLEKSLFDMQIAFLKENFNILRIEELGEAFEKGESFSKDSVLLTFDDGYVDHFNNVFPVLDKHAVQGSFYVTGRAFAENRLLDVNKIHFILSEAASPEIVLRDIKNEIDYYRGVENDIAGFEEMYDMYAKPGRYDSREVAFVKRILQSALPVKIRNAVSTKLFEKYAGISESIFARELYMNADQIECMKNHGMHIGVHGYDHERPGELGRKEFERDIEKALEVMGDAVDPDFWTMCMPYGSYNKDVTDVLGDKGCSLAFTTQVRRVDISVDGRLEIPRMDTNDFPPKSKSYVNYL